MAGKSRQKFVDFFTKGASSTFFIKVIAVIFTVLVILLVQWGIARKIESEKAKTQTPAQTQTEEPKAKEVIEFHLRIPKIKVDVPIVPYVDGGNETAYLKALESGVAHFQGTSLPGEGSNVFIFGHSSYYANKPGNHKQVFRRLPELEVGDDVEVILNGQKFIYLVTQKKTVDPNSVEYLQPTDSEQLSLMTCYPIGTTKSRLIVIAKPRS